MKISTLPDVNVPFLEDKSRTVQHNKSDVYKQNEEIFVRLTQTGITYTFSLYKARQKKFLDSRDPARSRI